MGGDSPMSAFTTVRARIDQLEAGQLAAVGKLLEVMIDPVARPLAGTPVEADPISAEEAADWTTRTLPSSTARERWQNGR
jgi:hypothetical protein